MYSSTPLTLAVANTLPTAKGSQSRTRTSPSTNPDSPVFAELNTSYAIDIRDMFADIDGLPDIDHLKIVDVLFGSEKLDMTIDKNNPLKVDPHPSQIRIPIGAAAGSFIVMDPNLNIPIVTLGTGAIDSLVLSAEEGSRVIEVENTVAAQKASSAYPARLEFIVKVTDGQMEKVKNPITNQFEYKPHIIELILPIDPHVIESTGQWRNRVGVPDIDVTAGVALADEVTSCATGCASANEGGNSHQK